MRRILVPLDGSELAATILPDARRLAGPDGELILVRDAYWMRYDKETGKYTDTFAADGAARYLEAQAAALREEGVRVQVHRLVPADIAWAISAAAELFEVDMIACATHGRGPLGRLLRGSVAWKVLAQSPVPVLLRHPPENWETGLSLVEPPRRKILVPLDGSEFAERALPLAQELATEWNASVWLEEVLPDPQMADSAAQFYLERIALRLTGNVHTDVFVAPSVAAALIEAVQDLSITDVVMTSHGRTGLSRVILGSVADELVQRLHCPIMIVPALAAETKGRIEATEERGVVAGGAKP